MTYRSILKTLWTAFKTLVLGSAVASNAVARTVSPAPVLPDGHVWASVRNQYENRDVNSSLPVSITESLEAAIREGQDLTRTIEFSYEALPHHLHSALDRFWLDQRAIQQDPALFETMLGIRQRLATHDALFRIDGLTGQWLHRAHHKPKHYDNGIGND